MRTVELFCGTKSFSKYAASLGHETFTVDIDPKFKPDMVHDILESTPMLLADKLAMADIIWMSPPCTTFSMAAGNKHWTANRKPITKDAIEGRDLLLKCQRIASFAEQQGKIWFIENPRARARWFLSEHNRYTVWYCKYGDTRAKPTDIWTNLKGWQARTCKNNGVCHHERAPRGSKSGTQGMSDSKERSRIPIGLFKELFEVKQ